MPFVVADGTGFMRVGSVNAASKCVKNHVCAPYRARNVDRSSDRAQVATVGQLPLRARTGAIYPDFSKERTGSPGCTCAVAIGNRIARAIGKSHMGESG